MPAGKNHSTNQSIGTSWQARPRRLSRRSVLSGGLALGALAASGCSVSRSGGLEYDLGSGDQLRVWTWDDYIDPALLPQIAQIMGISRSALVYDESYEDSNLAWEETIVPNLSNGNPLPYDILMPTNWLAARMIARDWVEPIPIELIPNHVNLDPAYMTQDWDRGARLQMPWQAGITGIAYNPALTGGPIESINQLLEPEFSGRVGMVAEMREALGFVMLAQGEDPSRPTAATARAAMDRLEALSGQGRFVWGFNELFNAEFLAGPGLANGTIAATMAWSGDTVLLKNSLPVDSPVSVDFVIPQEGAIQWFDTMVIPKGSPNIAAAGKWMNIVYDVSMAANITEFVQYLSPVLGVRDELRDRGGESAALADEAILFPDDETKRRLFTWGQLPIDVESELETRFAAVTGF